MLPRFLRLLFYLTRVDRGHRLRLGGERVKALVTRLEPGALFFDAARHRGQIGDEARVEDARHARIEAVLQAHRDLVIVARHGRKLVVAARHGLLEGIDGLLHAAFGHVGLAEVGKRLGLCLVVQVELERGLVAGDRVGRTPQLHEADAQVDERLCRSGVGRVERGLAVGGARLGHVAELELRGADAGVRLVRRRVDGVRERAAKGHECVLVVLRAQQRGAEVDVQRRLALFGAAGKRALVERGGGVRVAAFHVAVANEVVELAQIGRREVFGVLRASREALEGGLVIALRVGLLSLFENSCVHSVVSPIDTKCSAVAR